MDARFGLEREAVDERLALGAQQPAAPLVAAGEDQLVGAQLAAPLGRECLGAFAVGRERIRHRIGDVAADDQVPGGIEQREDFGERLDEAGLLGGLRAPQADAAALRFVDRLDEPGIDGRRDLPGPLQGREHDAPDLAQAPTQPAPAQPSAQAATLAVWEPSRHPGGGDARLPDVQFANGSKLAPPAAVGGDPPTSRDPGAVARALSRAAVVFGDASGLHRELDVETRVAVLDGRRCPVDQPGEAGEATRQPLPVAAGLAHGLAGTRRLDARDIWHSASTDPQRRWTGWLGRALDQSVKPADDVPALYLDGGPLSLALVGERIVVPSVADAGRFRVQGKKDLVAGVASRPREGDTLDYIRKSATQAYRTADRIEAALHGGQGRDAYPGSDLARRLWQIARMIDAQLPARVYAVRLTGFDTHSRQGNAHPQLLKLYGDAVGAFYKDLKAHGLSKRVLTVTYSEFGRRVKENRSLGTDHGAAAPMFVLGDRVEGGLHGKHPSLTDLDDGDLKHATDFRQVYATVLDRWLKVDSRKVLGAAYAPVEFV